MAFKITQKIDADSIQDKSLDMGFIAKYLKQIQKILLTKTTPETPTDYYLCNNYSGTDTLCVFGTHKPAYKKLFKETAKGKHGFDKDNISIGKCFVLKEEGKSILCIQHDKTQSKGKKATILKAFKKLQRSTLKQINEVRWMEGSIVAGGEEENEETQGTVAPNKANAPKTESAPVVSSAEIEARGKQLQEGIAKLKEDVIKRFKKRETTKKDADFVNALYKAANVWLSKLTQTDEKTAEKLAKQKTDLEKILPQLKDLGPKILNNKSNADVKKELKGVVKQMNAKRAKIKALLKRVDLKAMA